jgi:hypothetical protein
MKRIALALCLLSLLSGLATVSGQPLDSAARFRKGSDQYYKSGGLQKCELKGVVRLQGYLCLGWVWFHDNGGLQEFQLAESTEVQGIGFPARTWVSLDESGRLDYVFLPRNMGIQGVPCAGNRMGREGIMTSFYPNSKLRECFLAFSATVRNVPLRAGAFSPVEFHPDGGLKSGWLAEPYEASGTIYGKNTRLTFTEEGMVTESYRRNWFSQAWKDLLDVFF